MTRVVMVHPDLTQPIEVDEVSVPHYQASGWQREEDAQQERDAAAKGRRQKGK
ncbi:hypothetical protein AB0G64_09455 [Streptomyces longwoodensis]|uniref:hypothetical protein n=1 Tax=Streptomyces longwoodensis TaxID=68231 RepID=UPI0033D8AF27